MKKAAIIIASGFEEGEALTIADIIKRAHLQCDLVGFEQEVKGGHEIIVRCDHILNETLLDYDMVILPGGYGGAEAMKNNPTLISYLQQINEKGKYVCAMCAAPIVLEKANLLVDKKFTAYQGYDQKIKQGTYLNDKVVIDSNIVTSRGPATAYGFAYKLVELLGGDDLAVKKRMVYFSHLMSRRMNKMGRVAVLMAEGYEEGETLTIVDLLRRGGLECHTFSFNEEFVRGMHDMYVKADKLFNDEIKNYDMLVLPGGRPGGQNLLENQDVISLVQYFNEHHQYIAAMCSGTVVLEKANVIKGKKVTGYTGYQDKLVSGDFVNEVAVFDQNIVTSQGPATPYPFAFKILEVFGKDVTEMKERLMYNFAGGR